MNEDGLRDGLIRLTVIVENLKTSFDDLRLGDVKADVSSLKERMDKIERIVYGACAVVLLAVLGGLVTLVVKK